MTNDVTAKLLQATIVVRAQSVFVLIETGTLNHAARAHVPSFNLVLYSCAVLCVVEIEYTSKSLSSNNAAKFAHLLFAFVLLQFKVL